MISQRCPKCRSSRVRHGYTPTPIWSKVLFRYNLLCDACNWEFKGFAVPGTVSTKPTRKPKKKVDQNVAKINGGKPADENGSNETIKMKRKRVNL